MKWIFIGFLIFWFFACISIIVGVRDSKSKIRKNKQSKEIINMFTPKEDAIKISEYEKYFDEDEKTYKGWK